MQSHDTIWPQAFQIWAKSSTGIQLDISTKNMLAHHSILHVSSSDTRVQECLGDDQLYDNTVICERRSAVKSEHEMLNVHSPKLDRLLFFPKYFSNAVIGRERRLGAGDTLQETLAQAASIRMRTSCDPIVVVPVTAYTAPEFRTICTGFLARRKVV